MFVFTFLKGDFYHLHDNSDPCNSHRSPSIFRPINYFYSLPTVESCVKTYYRMQNARMNLKKHL